MGVTVALDPVTGENLAGDSDSYTSGTDIRRPRPRPASTRPSISTGVRRLRACTSSPFRSGWIAQVGKPGDDDTGGSAADTVSPLAGDLQIDVSPTTGYVYGIVTDGSGFHVEDATVTVNGATGTTDEFGRYRIRGFGAALDNDDKNRVSNVSVSMTGFAPGRGSAAFAANSPVQVAGHQAWARRSPPRSAVPSGLAAVWFPV